jgi:hypothetical protein
MWRETFRLLGVEQLVFESGGIGWDYNAPFPLKRAIRQSCPRLHLKRKGAAVGATACAKNADD